MRSRIVIGRFVDTGSWVHGLDPRAKTLGILLFMTVVFLTDSYWGILTVLGFSLLVMSSTRIPLTYYARAFKPLIFIMLFIFLFHFAFDVQGKRIMDTGLFTFYTGGLEKGVVAASRMMLFVSFAALLTFTTQPQRLAQGLGSLLKPIRYIGLSPDKLALMIHISLRFVPTIFEEAERIWKAQLSRGLELGGRPIRQRAGLILSLLVPVTTGAFRRAIELSDSMEARGYRLEAPRTSFNRLTWGLRDTLFLSLFLLPLTIVVLI